MTNYLTSNGDWYVSDMQKFEVRILVSSICDSLNRGSLTWDDDRAWKDLEMGHNEIREQS